MLPSQALLLLFHLDNDLVIIIPVSQSTLHRSSSLEARAMASSQRAPPPPLTPATTPVPARKSQKGHQDAAGPPERLLGRREG